MSDYRECPGCKKQLKRLTSEPEKYRKHTVMGRPEPCDFAGTVVVKEEGECPSESKSTATSEADASSASPPAEDAPEPAKPATSSTDSSPTSPDTEDDASTASEDASPALPGVSEYVTVLDAMSTEQLARYRASVDAVPRTPFSQPGPVEVDQPPLFSQPAADEILVGPVTFTPPADAVARPAPPPFAQPAGRRSEAPVIEMGDRGKELTARLKELFYAYDNRKSADNRSAQSTMGPSEMGTPCDRRLALSLMRMPPVNPGGDGWAAFVGTCIHAGLEQMFMWADAGTGRFATEQRLEFPSEIVPKGTADLIDRTLFMLDDHKCQGRWSRNKLKTTGPIPTYRVQAHVYAYGAKLRGEVIEHVAIISWPRDESTLDDLYVWTEPYRPDIVKQAFERVDDIAAENDREMAAIKENFPDAEELELKARVGMRYPVADDCRFCPFYLPNSRDPLQGCNGKQ